MEIEGLENNHVICTAALCLVQLIAVKIWVNNWCEEAFLWKFYHKVQLKSQSLIQVLHLAKLFASSLVGEDWCVQCMQIVMQYSSSQGLKCVKPLKLHISCNDRDQHLLSHGSLSVCFYCTPKSRCCLRAKAFLIVHYKVKS